MSNYIKKIMPSTIAIALSMGNITPPTKDDFYEDDSDFHKISSGLNTGWGWGISKAHAGWVT